MNNAGAIEVSMPVVQLQRTCGREERSLEQYGRKPLRLLIVANVRLFSVRRMKRSFTDLIR